MITFIILTVGFILVILASNHLTKKTKYSYDENQLDYDTEFYDKEFFAPAPFRNLRANPRMLPNRNNMPNAIIPRTLPPRTFTPQNQTASQGYNSNPDTDQFDLTVLKTIGGAGVGAVNLPFVLFSPAFLESDYLNIISQYVPAGTTLTITRRPNSITFHYEVIGVPANYVDIDVSSDITAYPTIVSALITDRFDVIKVRETISDNTILAQLQLPLQISNGSLFGGLSYNKISAAASKSPYQFAAGIIDFDAKFPLDKYRAMLSFISNSAPSLFSVTYSFWAKHVVKH